jgi:creatinine amidohydrolase
MHPSVPPDQGGQAQDSTLTALELGMGIHAGTEETSVMLHLRPDLVKLELGKRGVPEHLTSFERVGFGKQVSFGWLSNDFGTDGTLGDPTGSTAEHGKRKYEAMIVTAAQSLAEIARFDPRPPR